MKKSTASRGRQEKSPKVPETFPEAEQKLDVTHLFPFKYVQILPFYAKLTRIHSAKHICAHICVLTQTRASLHNITWQTHAAARRLTEKNRLSTLF